MSSRKPWAWFLMGAASTIALLVAIVVIVAAVLLISDDTDDSFNTTLIEFVREAQAGNIAFAEVDGQEIKYELINDPDATFKTKMEKGDTVRQVLQDAGIEPQDFPPIKPK